MLRSSLLREREREREGADRECDRIISSGEAHVSLDPAIRDVSKFCVVSFFYLNSKAWD